MLNIKNGLSFGLQKLAVTCANLRIIPGQSIFATILGKSTGTPYTQNTFGYNNLFNRLFYRCNTDTAKYYAIAHPEFVLEKMQGNLAGIVPYNPAALVLYINTSLIPIGKTGAYMLPYLPFTTQLGIEGLVQGSNPRLLPSTSDNGLPSPQKGLSVPKTEGTAINEMQGNVSSNDRVNKVEINTCDSIKKIINDKGYSVGEFAQLLHPDRTLSDSQKLLVNTVRKEIGLPSTDTLMCKVIPQSDIYKYLYNRDYDGVRGFTAIEEHGTNLKTLLDKYNGARLDYNNTAFKTTNGVDGISQSVGLPDKVYGTIEYKANDVSKISIPDWAPKPDDYPYTGKAFTGSTDLVLPEYYQSARKFINGDKFKILDSKTGDIVQQFIYDDKLGWLELK